MGIMVETSRGRKTAFSQNMCTRQKSRTRNSKPSESPLTLFEDFRQKLPFAETG